MITLNLISPQKKQELRLTQVYLAIKNLIILILFLATIIAIILLITKVILQNYFNEVVSDTTLTTKYANIFSEDIKKFNQQIKLVDKIQQKYIPWPNFFINFTKLMPDDIGIDSLTINENKILITGLAKTRAKLLELEDNLKKSDLFLEVTVPLENLLRKENISFNIKADLNLNNFKQK